MRVLRFTFLSLMSLIFVGDRVFSLEQRNTLMPPKSSGYRIQLGKVQTSTPHYPDWVNKPNPLMRGTKIQGSWQALVVLIDFTDYTWDNQSDTNFVNNGTPYTPEHFEQMLFSLGTYKDRQSQSSYTGSMRDFFLENSYGQFDITGTVTIWYRAAHEYSYYCNSDGKPNTTDDFGFGAYPHNVRKLVEEATASADSVVDFSLFDNNGDGVVDSYFVVHAGPGAEAVYSFNYSAHFNYFWSHMGFINPQVRDGVIVSVYTLEPEDGTIGVFCHEYGHALDLPDLYDIDRSSEGIGEWGLMGSGGWNRRSGDKEGTGPAHLTAWSKSKLGWLHPINVTSCLLNQRIPPVETEPIAFKLWRNGDPKREYFLIENRQNIGFDMGLTRRQKDFGLPDANGLVIYHIDESIGHNSNELHKMVDVEEASSLIKAKSPYENLDHHRYLFSYQFLDSGNRGDNGDPFPGYSQTNSFYTDFIGPRDRDVFSDTSIPNNRDYQNQPTGVAVENIRIEGQDIIADLIITSVTGNISANGRQGRNLATLFELAQNHPNPFNSSTVIGFKIPPMLAPIRVVLKVYNILGEEVKTLVDATKTTGFYEIYWEGTDSTGKRVASGIYWYKLSTTGFSTARKMLLLR